MIAVEYWYFAPLLYLFLICAPFVFPNVLFKKQSSSQSKYDESIILFVNINQHSEGDNAYYTDKVVWVDAFFENEDDYGLEGVSELKVFRNVEMDDADLEAFIFDLRDFMDHCTSKLNKQPFVVLQCSTVDYEAYLRDYGIKNLVNIHRLYGFHNKDLSTVPSSSSVSLLRDIMVADDECVTNVIEILEDWVR